MTHFRLKAPLLLSAIAALLLAVWAGLQRMGWQMPIISSDLPAVHGPLMMTAFLGTLISLERVVALMLIYKTPWLYLVPAASALGGIAMLVDGMGAAGLLLSALGSLGLVILFVMITRRHPVRFSYIMLLGAILWLAGNILLLLGRPVFSAVWWWAAFLVLTIAGERLELARIVKRSQAQSRLFLAVVGLMPAALVVTLFNYQLGVRLLGAAFIGLALWFLGNDIARSTIRKSGLPRFAAASLLSGYFWLLIGGGLALWFGGVVAGLRYDAVLHALFLGFIMSMIFGHAPIIFPAVLGRPIQFHRRFYSHLLLLNITLIIRVAADLGGWTAGRQWGGMLNAIALLLFLANTVWSLRGGEAAS